MPKLVLHLLFLLSHLRRLSSWLLRLTGLDVADHVISLAPEDSHQQQQYYHHDLEEHSPAVRFDSLSSSSASSATGAEDKEEEALPEGCAVCLGDFDGAAEVRRARGCRHVFHRACLDRWAAHGQHTCPLCRSPFLPPLPLPAS
ncbi:hypothetical protein PR202_ga18382 [Eleusine coracana subsp. coracana]|uniref:RING-type domain-containing protein n=1 Tax=Eleusine coracana subsp. coracana TaxID=191504 RepID=A0AAV5CRQ1_ELECO|nr:hypothetical protein PR202_ga18382 [Eleusine coracana subsp. coracana]